MLKPTTVEAFPNSNSRRYIEAIEDFKESQELDRQNGKKDNAGIFDGQGSCFHALRDYDQALSFFHQAIEKDPRNTHFLMNRAQCYYDLKQFTDAVKDLSTALQVNDSDPQILYRLGLSYYAFEKYKKCIKTLKASLLNKPFHSYEADIYYHIGLAYCNQEKFEKAIYPFSVVRSYSSYFNNIYSA
jgi:tetratricopeptide (TPR) repeat protein